MRVEELAWVSPLFRRQAEIWGENLLAGCAAVVPSSTGVKDGDGYG
jgi:hypothetical protein